MWGWESACDLCGAPYCLCDCLEQLKAANKDLKRVRDLLIKDLKKVGALTDEEYDEITSRHVEVNAPWYKRWWRSLWKGD